MGAGSRRPPARPLAPASRRVAAVASATPLCVWVGRAGAMGCALSLLAGMKLGWEGAAASRCFMLAGLFAVVGAAGALVALLSPYHPEIDGLAESGRRSACGGSDDSFDGDGGGD